MFTFFACKPWSSTPGCFGLLGLFEPRKFLGVLSVFYWFSSVFLSLERVNFLGILGGFPWFLQKDAVVRLEAISKHVFSHQSEEYAHQQQTLFQEFDGAIKDKDDTVHVLQQELANHKEQHSVSLNKHAGSKERKIRELHLHSKNSILKVFSVEILQREGKIQY